MDWHKKPTSNQLVAGASHYHYFMNLFWVFEMWTFLQFFRNFQLPTPQITFPLYISKVGTCGGLELLRDLHQIGLIPNEMPFVNYYADHIIPTYDIGFLLLKAFLQFTEALFHSENDTPFSTNRCSLVENVQNALAVLYDDAAAINHKSFDDFTHKWFQLISRIGDAHRVVGLFIEFTVNGFLVSFVQKFLDIDAQLWEIQNLCTISMGKRDSKMLSRTAAALSSAQEQIGLLKSESNSELPLLSERLRDAESFRDSLNHCFSRFELENELAPEKPQNKTHSNDLKYLCNRRSFAQSCQLLKFAHHEEVAAEVPKVLDFFDTSAANLHNQITTLKVILA